MLYSSADFHNPCLDTRILTPKAMLPLLVVRRRLNPFLYSCWHVYKDYFTLCNGRYHFVWEIGMIWSGLKWCSFTHNWAHKPLQKMIHPWWTQNRKQICSAREHELPEFLLQRNCRANSWAKLYFHMTEQLLKFNRVRRNGLPASPLCRKKRNQQILLQEMRVLQCSQCWPTSLGIVCWSTLPSSSCSCAAMGVSFAVRTVSDRTCWQYLQPVRFKLV